MISDQEFIKVWRENPSVAEVSKIIGVKIRAVNYRRRTLEKKYAIRLAAYSPKSPDSLLITHDRVEVKIKLRTGVILATGDLHFWPDHVPVMHRAMCYLAKKLKPYAVVWNGDVADFPQI